MTILACDVGGTEIKLGLVRGGRIDARAVIPAHAGRGLAAALPRIGDSLSEMCVASGTDRGAVRGVGLAFPAVVEPGTERILSTPVGKFDDAPALDVHAAIRAVFGLASFVVNDANAALAGEWAHGAARGARDVGMLTLGTGIGSSVIVDGVPVRGRHGSAGNLGGHVVANVGGRACTCGGLGCAEAEASGWAVEAMAAAHPDFGRSALAAEPSVDYRAVFRLAALGDPVSIAVRDRSLQVWAGAVVSLVHAYDLERVILGGGVMRAGDAILGPIRAHVARHAWAPWGSVDVVPAALGNDAGMLGVAWLMEQGRPPASR
jgi:glucokinase